MNRFDLIKYEKRGLDYVLLIDRAILQKRYRLAIQLANRYLNTYYQVFLKSVRPRYRFRRINTYQAAVRMVRYIRKYPRRYSWFSKQERQFNILSVSFNLSHSVTTTSEHSHLLYDRASAEYARTNSVAIVQRLMNYMKDRRGRS